MHDIIGDRGGDEEGDRDQYGKFPGEQIDDIGDGGAEDFPDTDFLCFLNDQEGDEPVEAERGDE